MVHIGILVVLGTTSAAKPIEVEQLKVVRVDLVKTPDQIAVDPDKPDAPKPKTAPEPAKIDVPYVPPVNKMVVDNHPPRPAPIRPQPRPAPSVMARTPGNPNVPASTVPGNPGGEIKMGSTTNHGQDLGSAPHGNTPSGYVPSTNGGPGVGSGNGPGVGTAEPNPNAQEGPGTRPAPAPVYVPPPPPKMVSVTVCAASGLLPGKYCEKRETRTFREGTEPKSVCDRCKAPEPVHVNRMADRSEPELIKDPQPKLPDMDESGNYTVGVHYTVDKDGGVSEIEISESSGVPAIDRAVREAVAKRRYKPAVQNGEPRSVRMKVKFRISV